MKGKKIDPKDATCLFMEWDKVKRTMVPCGKKAVGYYNKESNFVCKDHVQVNC